MNRVRAGAVAHPSEWDVGGYAEILARRKSPAITDYGALMELLNIKSIEALRELRKNWVGEVPARGRMRREVKWSQSVAAGGKDFVENVKAKL